MECQSQSDFITSFRLFIEAECRLVLTEFFCFYGTDLIRKSDAVEPLESLRDISFQIFTFLERLIGSVQINGKRNSSAFMEAEMLIKIVTHYDELLPSLSLPHIGQ
jgi:hypothetical protein